MKTPNIEGDKIHSVLNRLEIPVVLFNMELSNTNLLQQVYRALSS